MSPRFHLSKLLFGGALVSGLSACPFDDEIAKGEACQVNADCGPSLDCVDFVCGGGGSSEPEPCPYTNDGACDEPEGTGLCAEGSDIIDCESSGESATSGPAPTTSSGETGGTSCVDPGESCAAGQECCGTAVCVNFDGVGVFCSAQCSSGSGCGGCCCGETDSGTGVCSPPSFCGGNSTCPSGGGCALGFSKCSFSGECCNGECLMSSGGDNLCFDRCFSDSDCSTNCCTDGPNGQICNAASACMGDIGDPEDEARQLAQIPSP